MKSTLFVISFISVLVMSSTSLINTEILQQTGDPEITAREAEMLKYMREEEKLARDVYLYFYDMYEMQVFSNIASSEQRHMDLILELTEKYTIEDFASEENGVFINKELQKLYDDLIKKGSKSLVDALEVGATIEDVDIYDLEKFLDQKPSAEMASVFEILNFGSRNHMRAFTRQLNRKEVKYEAQYITSERYQSVLDGSHERCGMMNQYIKGSKAHCKEKGQKKGNDQCKGNGQKKGQKANGQGKCRGN